MDLDPEVSASSVGVALAGLSESLDQVIDVVESGGLDELGVMGMVNAVQGFERVRSRMALIDHRIVGDCERRQVADELNLRTTRTLLTNVLRLSSLEAGRRVRAAAAVGARTSMVGEPMGPLRPILADAQRQGEVTPEQVAAAEESLRDMEDLDVAPDKVTAAEQTLVEYARAFDPRQLSRVGEKLADIAAPDGKAPDDSVLQLKRRFEMATGRDGAVRGKFCLTPDVGAALAAVLSPLAKPRMDPPVGGGHLADAHKDSRSPEQRMHDALGDLCSWALRGGGLATAASSTPASTTRAATDAKPEKAPGQQTSNQETFDRQDHDHHDQQDHDHHDRDQQDHDHHDRDQQDHDHHDRDQQDHDHHDRDQQDHDHQDRDQQAGSQRDGGHQADAGMPDADQAGTATSDADQTAAHQSAAEAASTNPAGTDHAGTDHAGTDHAGTDHAGTDHAGTDHAGTDHAGARERGSTAPDGESPPAPPLFRPGPPAAPTTVIVTIDINDLLNRTGKGETSFGNFITPEQLLRLASEAEIYPTVITANGVPLHLGRTRRLASRAQSIALIARDGGCSFPGCDHPPEWCDKHHITAWIDGGPTDLDNLTLLCRYHHTRFLGKGWTCHINTDGVPAWTPPRWQDPAQTPLVHLRILRRQLERQIERARTERPEGESPKSTVDIPTPRNSSEGDPYASGSTGCGRRTSGSKDEPTTTTPAGGSPTTTPPADDGQTTAPSANDGQTTAPSANDGQTTAPSADDGQTTSGTTQSAPTSTTPTACAQTAESSEGTRTWLDVVAADLRRAQTAREAVLSAAAEERGRRLGALWCPDDDDDLNAHSWSPEEIWEAGWRPADPHPERLGSPWEG